MKSSHLGILDRFSPGRRRPDNGGNGHSGHTPFHDDEYVHLIAENARDLIFHAQIVPEFKFDYVSPSSTRITGYTPEEFYADPMLSKKCIHPDDLKLLIDPNLPEAPSTYEPLDIRWKCKDGHEIWTEQLATITRNELGKPIACQIIARDITERKKAEAALLETQKFNASLLENAPHATVVINPDTSVKYVNPAWEKLNGWTLAEVVGMKVPYPWWPAEFIDAFAEGFKEAMKQGTGKAEVIAQKKNGEIYWIDMNWASVMNNGEMLYLLINSVDITERMKSQEALKESESKYRSIFESANDIIILMDHESTIIDINGKVKEIAGYEREDFIGHNLRDLTNVMSKSSLATTVANFHKRLAGSTLPPYEVEMRKKNGELINFEINAMPLKINDKVSGDLAILRDITLQKRSMLAIKESEEKFSKAFSSSPNAVCIVSAIESRFIEVNKSFMHFTGYNREEIIGHTPIELNLWVNDDDFKRTTKIIQETGKLDNEIVKSRMKSGEIRTGLFSADTIEIGGEKCMILVITDTTEQIHAQQALKESEEKFSRAFHCSPDIMAISSLKDGRYVEVNESFTRCNGYTRDEIIGHTVSDINTWANKKDRIKMLRSLRENGRVYNEEYQFIVKSGEIHTMLFSAEPINIGDEPCLISVCNDITERKQMEKALRESEEKFSKAFAASPEIIGITTIKDGKYVDVNDSYTLRTGYSREELIGHTTTSIHIWVNDADRAKMTRLLQEQGRVHNEEFDFRMKSGEIRTWLFSLEPITIGGEPCLIGVSLDITGRKRMEQALRESEEKFSAAFHSSPDMIIITDTTEGKYLDVNESFVQNTGYTREELVGHSISEFNLWVDPAEVELFTQTLQKQGKIRNEVYKFRRKTGETRTWLCSADVVSIGGEIRMLAVAADITERKKAEEALKESEEKFSKAFNASPFSISISRLGDGKFIEVNDSYLLDKGYTREELIGHSAKNFNIWVNHSEVTRVMQTVMGHGRVHNEQLQYRTKSGHIRTGLVSAEIINISNEPCMLVMNNDITQQKLAEEQLRLLSSVTEQVSDATIITDPHFKVTYMNQAAQDLFGYNIEEARGKSLNLFNERPISESALQEILDKISTDKVWRGTTTKKQKNGNIIICDCNMSPLYDEKGQLSFYIDVQRDITRQKEVEAKLQEHKKLIDSILSTMPEGVLVIDSKDRIILANKAFYDIFHIRKTAMKNKTLNEILPADQFFDLHNAVKSGEMENNTLEFRYQAQDLEKIIYSIIVKMDGERTLLTFTDISQEREEEEKLYLTDRLASIGEMAAGLAHELNNPLTGILALSQMLVGSDLPEEHKEDMECIYSEAKRAASIVKNVLLFARNKTDVSGRTSINDVVKDVLRLREYEERSSNIKVVTDLEEDLPEISLDKGQLQQVCLNIISNAEAAIKEVDRPGVITVATQRVNNHVNILLSDNGCGIKKQFMPRIFDPFFTTKEIGKGTGLGLSICYSIIVKHGGKISVKSQVNEGTTFTIRMPIVSPER